MQTVLFFFINVVASIVAVKLTSTALKSSKNDWLSSVIAVALSLVVLTTINNFISIELLGIVVSILVVGFVLESILETTFVNGMLIAAAAVIVQWIVKFVFIKLGVNTDMLLFLQQFLSSST